MVHLAHIQSKRAFCGNRRIIKKDSSPTESRSKRSLLLYYFSGLSAITGLGLCAIAIGNALTFVFNV